MLLIKIILMPTLAYLYEVHGFSYDNLDWAVEYPTCGGTRQTPIDVTKVSSVSFGLYSTPLQIQNLRQTPASLELKNNGHGANFVFTWSNPPPILAGGPLKSVYTFHSLHFHWGPDDKVGSEHLVDGKSTPIEGHLIFQNSNYPDFNTALQNGDGLAVVGFRYTCSRTARRFALLDLVTNIPNFEDTFTLSSNVPRITELLSGSFFRFVHYEGGLTTPPCTEAVQWIFNFASLPIDCSQLVPLRALKQEDGSNTLRNYRPVQPLNNRKLYRGFGLVN